MNYGGVPRTTAAYKYVTEIGDYILENTIGQGSFGKVKLAHHKDDNSGRKFAIKLVEKLKLRTSDERSRIWTESNIMMLMNHPNIIITYNILDTPIYHAIVMEYAKGGELFDYVLNKGKLDVDEARLIMRQLLSALIYCHHHHIMHRDVKLENLLLDDEKNLKVIDFGLSSIYSEDECHSTQCGSLHYMAPEIIAGKKYNGQSVDVWCCGIVLYILLCGSFPFDVPEEISDFKKYLMKLILDARYDYPFEIDEKAKDFIASCLRVDVEKRAKLNILREHPFITEKFEETPLLDYIKYHELPVKEPCALICEKMHALNFAEVVEILQNSTEPNIVTSIYFLLLDQPIRESIHKKAHQRRPHCPLRASSSPPNTLTIPTKNHSRQNSGHSMIQGYCKEKSILVENESHVCAKTPLEDLLNQIKCYLYASQIKYIMASDYIFICEDDGLRFEIQVGLVKTKEQCSVKVKRLKGNILIYELLKKHILKSLKVHA